MTARAFIAGQLLAILLCGVNSYLTLSFGIMEEGPTIAALFFFAIMYAVRKRPNTEEMVMVATMGSAGGSLAFIANFFAARAMVAVPYTVLEMFFFCIATSMVGLAAVIPLRHLLIVKDAELPENERLPWVGSRAVKGMIDALLVEDKRNKQPMYLAIFLIAAVCVAVLNDDNGFGLVPASVPIFGITVALGVPFLFGAAGLMGMRTCVGFLIGGIALYFIAPYTDTPAAPHRFIWPGVAFLVASGLTALAVNWRMIRDAFTSMRGGGKTADNDPIMSKRSAIWFTVIAVFTSGMVLHFGFKIGVIVIIGMVSIGGLVLNIIATRAAAQTAFNPARVMGILLQGVSAGLGGSSMGTNLAGAGFVAGSGAQAGNLTGDMAYGFWYKIHSRKQFWMQASTVVFSSITAALVMWLILDNFKLSLEGGDLSAPVAKAWAAMALLFDPESGKTLPDTAISAMFISGIVSTIWTLVESKQEWNRWIPSSTGVGLALILPAFFDFGFFVGGILMYFILPRFATKTTISTLAIALIIGEGFGGIVKGVFNTLGIIKGGN